MKFLNKEDCENMIIGGTLMGTGGGADPNRGMRLIKDVGQISIVKLEELDEDNLVCCTFMIGSSSMSEKSSLGATLAKELFLKIVNTEIKAIVPVEIGGGALGEAIFMSNELKLPIVDGDIVGFRAAPEVFLETITMKNLKRTPLVVANNKGDVACLTESNNYKFIEKFLRSFAINSENVAYVCGYPLKVKDLKGVIGEGSVSLCVLLGSKMRESQYCEVVKEGNFYVIGEGVVKQINLKNEKGFLIGKYYIEGGRDNFTIKVKNENIVCLKNANTIITSPDLICMYDLKKNKGTYNAELKTGTLVAIFARKAIPLWRSKKGISLFSPSSLGFNEDYVQFEKLI